MTNLPQPHLQYLPLARSLLLSKLLFQARLESNPNSASLYPQRLHWELQMFQLKVSLEKL
jgi:hypothetical protein